MDDRSGRYILERQTVTQQNVGVRAGAYDAPDFQTHRRDDVALFAVHVVQQSDARSAVGIVFNRSYFGTNSDFIALKIDDPVGFFVSAALKSRRNATRARPPASPLFARHQTLFRFLFGNVLARNNGLKSPRGSCRPVTFDWHLLNLRVFRHLLAGLQSHVGLFPVGPIAREPAAPAQLSGSDGSADIVHFDFEQRLHSLANLRFIGARGDFETQGPLFVFFGDAFFGHQRLLDHVVNADHASASDNLAAAASDNETC